MASKPDSSAAFAKALRSFQTGGLTYGDFLARVQQQLDAGAQPAELLEIVQRREAVEPLAPETRHALLHLITGEAATAAPGTSRGTSGGASAMRGAASRPQRDATYSIPLNTLSSEAPTIILGEGENDTEAPAAPPSQSAAAKLGDTVLRRYRLIELLGQGGMSRVFKAIDSRDPTPDVYVAVKVLSRPFGEPEAFATFAEEVGTLHRLAHPNIVRMLGCDRDGPTAYLLMEYLDGASLYARLHGGATPPGQAPGIDAATAPRIVAAIAGALDYAHRRQVVHGDLKPGNVIITARGEVKVIDFGVASWIARPKTAGERREAAQRQAGMGVTPRYASPQLMARQKPEVTDDVYALACMAYELLTGIHPFNDGNGAPPLRNGLNATQHTALVHALQLERSQRTPTIAQFLAEFDATPRRSAWKSPLPWLAAVVLLALGGWLYQRFGPGSPATPTHAAAPLAAEHAARGAPTNPNPPEPARSGTAPGPGGGTVFRDCPTCPPLTVLPAGHFEQGAVHQGATHSTDAPPHAVSIAYPFALASHPVTVAEFRDFIAATGRDMRACDVYDGQWHRQASASWQAPGFAQTDTHPVTCISWDDASAYAHWLSSKTGHVYRLPSASEWEYAARAGSTAVHPWDVTGAHALGAANDNACAYANVADQSAEKRYPGWDVFACDDGYVNTAPVGRFRANAFGLTDMLGNVYEWTQDCWHGDYLGAPSNGAARLDGACRERELRGGSWFSAPATVRASYRNHFKRDYRTSSVGFRVAREMTP